MGDHNNSAGTSETKFQFGKGGPLAKFISSVILAFRNNDDTLYAQVQAALFQTFGNDFELNSGAAGTGADRKMTLRRPSTGMTVDVVIVMPASGVPTVGDALTVASVAGGVVTLQYTASVSGTDSLKSDTTSIAFGTTSPLAMFNLPANAIVREVTVLIDTVFNGTPSLSIGITGSTSKYMPATAVDLKSASGDSWSFRPVVAAPVAIESLIATYAAGGATAGAGRVLVDYVIPS